MDCLWGGGGWGMKNKVPNGVAVGTPHEMGLGGMVAERRLVPRMQPLWLARSRLRCTSCPQMGSIGVAGVDQWEHLPG